MSPCRTLLVPCCFVGLAIRAPRSNKFAVPPNMSPIKLSTLAEHVLLVGLDLTQPRIAGRDVRLRTIVIPDRPEGQGLESLPASPGAR